MNRPSPRLPHAVLDLRSRQAKARKIEILLGLDSRAGRQRFLEVGTGSGGIAHYFGTHPSSRFEVHAVDVADNRMTTEGYEYHQVQGTSLPFPDGYFDVVVSNHVIEHVGEVPEQKDHLREIYRVMADDGVGYLAVPSRWMLVEPHFRLPLLSWLPVSVADPYVRLAKKGRRYDCRPLTVPIVEEWLAGAGFDAEQIHGRALKLTYALENPGSIAYRVALRHIPESWYRTLRKAFPTLIYRVVKRGLPGRPRDRESTAGQSPPGN